MFIFVLSGKLLVIDEAHKFMDGVSTDGLSNAIVDIARLMRHDGIRLVVSTQSPKALAPELLELSSVAVMHQFTSREWFDHMAHKLPLSPAAFDKIMSLRQGQALVFAKRHSVGPAVRIKKEVSDDSDQDSVVSDVAVDSLSQPYGTNMFPVSVRPRITLDLSSDSV